MDSQIIKEIEQIKKYIGRLKKQNKAKEILIPVISLLIALISIIASSITQKNTIEASIYSATVSIKITNYSTLMADFEKIYGLTGERILINTGTKNELDSYYINQLDSVIDNRKDILMTDYFKLSLLLNEKTRKETQTIIDSTKELCDSITRYSSLTNRKQFYNQQDFVTKYSDFRLQLKRKQDEIMNILINFFSNPSS